MKGCVSSEAFFCVTRLLNDASKNSNVSERKLLKSSVSREKALKLSHQDVAFLEDTHHYHSSAP